MLRSSLEMCEEKTKKKTTISSSLVKWRSAWQQINENVTWLLPQSLALMVWLTEHINIAARMLPCCLHSHLLQWPLLIPSSPFSNLSIHSLREPYMLVWLKTRAKPGQGFEWSFTLSWHNRVMALWRQGLQVNGSPDSQGHSISSSSQWKGQPLVCTSIRAEVSNLGTGRLGKSFWFEL